jgi:hypothetical protein
MNRMHPDQFFIRILAATALLRFITCGLVQKDNRGVENCLYYSALHFWFISFIAGQARTGIYPQLENPRSYSGYMYKNAHPVMISQKQMEPEMAPMERGRMPMISKMAERAEDAFTLSEVNCIR